MRAESMAVMRSARLHQDTSRSNADSDGSIQTVNRSRSSASAGFDLANPLAVNPSLFPTSRRTIGLWPSSQRMQDFRARSSGRLSTQLEHVTAHWPPCRPSVR